MNAKKIILMIGLIVILAVIGYWGFLVMQKTSEESNDIKVVYPNGGEIWSKGQNVEIIWNVGKDIKFVNIRLEILGSEEGQNFNAAIVSNIPNTGSYEWTVQDLYAEVWGIKTLPASDKYIVSIEDSEHNNIYDNSDAVFAIDEGNWQTYVNKEVGYSIGYPGNWVVREFPDIKSGGGFRPENSPDDISSECIVIDARVAPANESATPFEEYVRKAAAAEIQNYEKLNSIQAITTVNGLVGYETTWIYKDVSGNEKISLPIAYFDNKENKQAGQNQPNYKTIQVILNSRDCEKVYNQMLPTFKFGE